MESFGARLKRLREARGWLQRELGQHADMDAAQVSRYERGVIKEASADVLARLARALNVSVTELRGDEPLAVDEDRKRIGSVWSRATPEQKRKIMAAIRRAESEQTQDADPQAS